MTGDAPINLNRVRKTRARDDKKRLAEANVLKHGRSKAERDSDAARKSQSEKRLDSHARDNE